MLKMSKESEEFLRKNIPEALEKTKVNDALDLIDDWITYWGFDKNWDLNDKGREGQEVYDDIYYLNP